MTECQLVKEYFNKFLKIPKTTESQFAPELNNRLKIFNAVKMIKVSHNVHGRVTVPNLCI